MCVFDVWLSQSNQTESPCHSPVSLSEMQTAHAAEKNLGFTAAWLGDSYQRGCHAVTLSREEKYEKKNVPVCVTLDFSPRFQFRALDVSVSP